MNDQRVFAQAIETQNEIVRTITDAWLYVSYAQEVVEAQKETIQAVRDTLFDMSFEFDIVESE